MIGNDVLLPQPYFLSLHHQFHLDVNLAALAPLDERNTELIRQAAGVLMPKYCSPGRHRQVAHLAKAYFPNLSSRYRYRGKAQQIPLFQAHGVPYPETMIFEHPQALTSMIKARGQPMEFPYVLKGNSGGGGANVFCIQDEQSLFERIKQLPEHEPVLIQEWVDHGGMDLRVVLMGRIVHSYFRVGGGDFYNNVSKGARIEADLFPEKQQQGRDMALDLARAAGIDLAGFDILFPVGGRPLFLEVNFLFGRKGLGGLQGYRRMFRQAVQDWMDRVRMDAAPN
jgi:ribosomal protein S6--L-glutamate ligase